MLNSFEIIIFGKGREHVLNLKMTIEVTSHVLWNSLSEEMKNSTIETSFIVLRLKNILNMNERRGIPFHLTLIETMEIG